MAKSNFTDNYTAVEGLSALSRTANTYYTEAVDHATYRSVDFFVTCGTWATSFVATLQNSDDNSTWTDEADTTAGNDVSLTLTAAGSGTVEAPNPRARYSRLKVVIGGTCVFGVASLCGLRRHAGA